MLDPKEALKHIRTLAKVGADAGSEELMIRHFEEIVAIVEKALKPDQPPASG